MARNSSGGGGGRCMMAGPSKGDFRVTRVFSWRCCKNKDEVNDIYLVMLDQLLLFLPPSVLPIAKKVSNIYS